MYCELKDKEVELRNGLEIKIGNTVIKVFKMCSDSSDNYMGLEGENENTQCDMDHDERCLQNRF